MELISKKGYEKLCEEYHSMDQKITDTQRKMGESAKRDNDLRENPEFMELRVKAMYTLPAEKEQLYKKYLLNNIKWGCLREAILKKFDINLTEQDIEEYSEIYELSHNSDVKNLEKYIDYGSFLGISDNINKNDFILDCKLTQKLLTLCNVKHEVVNFGDFAKFLKVKILENFEKFKGYESEK